MTYAVPEAAFSASAAASDSRPLADISARGNARLGGSLTSLQQRLVKTGVRLVKHARYYWLFLAEGHLTRRLFGSMVRQIAVLSLPAG